ncbi:MAG: hypothetical protein LIO63_06735 [Akkermansia sp.]|nr:hypothetical protein [Akkermansia sp.]
MKMTCIHTLPAALLTLAAVSCSPIVAEYTYRGSVSGTNSRTASRVLNLKEYKDGTVSGQLSIPAAAADPYSCGSIGGRVDNRRISFYLTALGDSYLGAKMGVKNNSSGTTVKYQGNISRDRRYLSGKWNAASDHRSYIRGGSFSFSLTHINGKAVTRKTGTRKNGTESPAIEKEEIPTFSVESEGTGSTPVGFTVE